MTEFVVLFDYAGENEGDLELVFGETITVLKQEEHGWWLGAKADEAGIALGSKGYFPKNYVKPKPPQLPPRPAGLGSDLKKAPADKEEEVDKAAEEEEEENEEGAGGERGSIFFESGEDGHLDFDMSR